jgi:hypothetical protein
LSRTRYGYLFIFKKANRCVVPRCCLYYFKSAGEARERGLYLTLKHVCSLLHVPALLVAIYTGAFNFGRSRLPKVESSFSLCSLQCPTSLIRSSYINERQGHFRAREGNKLARSNLDGALPETLLPVPGLPVILFCLPRW